MNIIEQRKRMRGQGGFTLIELLVVVAILAILAGVAVFAVGNLTDNAGTAACNTEKSTIRTANAAANATSIGTDDYTAFIDSTTTPKFFTVVAGGTGNSRTVTLTRTAESAPGCTA